MFQNSRKSIIFIVVMLLVLVMSMTAFATAYAIDFQAMGSISINLRESESHKILHGTKFTIYKVADVINSQENFSFIYTENFKNNGMKLDDLNADGLARHLNAYARVENIDGITEKASKDGSVLFEDLSLGLYLVVEEGRVDGYYSTPPFLVSIPLATPEGQWIYDVVANPKVEERPDKDPKPIGPPDGSEIPPKIPETTPRVPEDKSDPPLIQTGQLNWPIPILAGAGIILFAFGWYLTFLRKGKDHEK